MNRVYVGMVADLIHHGHINLLEQASKYGLVTVGLLTDDAAVEYKDKPVLNFENRKKILESISYVNEIVAQNTLDYTFNLRKIKPNFVVHGDDWKYGPQSKTRSKVLEVIAEFGGKLIEIPYSEGISSTSIKDSIRHNFGNLRSGKLKNLIDNQNRSLRFIDLHSGLSGLIAEEISVEKNGLTYSFDGMWASSLTDSTNRGKPDIEAVDVSARIHGLQDILECTTKPIIFDGDTGGRPEHFAFTVKSLDRNGISAVIIEDKFGLKRNSLLEHDEPFTLEDPELFAEKIKAGNKAKVSKDFMIIARIESLILGGSVNEAIQRAIIYKEAGADGIMIHSRKSDGLDALRFIEEFRKIDQNTPLVIIPTSFSHISEKEFWNLGVNIVIYANHLLRASYPAMKMVAEQILIDGKAKNIEKSIMSMKEILNLIPGT